MKLFQFIEISLPLVSLAAACVARFLFDYKNIYGKIYIISGIIIFILGLVYQYVLWEENNITFFSLGLLTFYLPYLFFNWLHLKLFKRKIKNTFMNYTFEFKSDHLFNIIFMIAGMLFITQSYVFIDYLFKQNIDNWIVLQPYIFQNPQNLNN